MEIISFEGRAAVGQHRLVAARRSAHTSKMEWTALIEDFSSLLICSFSVRTPSLSWMNHAVECDSASALPSLLREGREVGERFWNKVLKRNFVGGCVSNSVIRQVLRHQVTPVIRPAQCQGVCLVVLKGGKSCLHNYQVAYIITLISTTSWTAASNCVGPDLFSDPNTLQ